jgi:hypothetical protein
MVLGAAALATLLGCSTTVDQQAAVDVCRKYGNASEPCGMANRMLASGSPHIAQALQAGEQARVAAEKKAAEAQARAQQLAAQGVDPCAKLRDKLAADHPAPACGPKVDEAVSWLKSDPGCAAALDDPEGTALTAADLLGDCDKP